MPKPHADETQSEWMHRCMHRMVRVEDKPQEQAVAICLNMWRRAGKSASSSDTGQRIAMLLASSETQNALQAWAERQGFDLTSSHSGREIPADKFDFHVTLLATANPVYIPETQHMIQPVEIEPEGFDTLGEDGDVPVLRLAADGAHAMARDYFVELYGAEPTFADFKPHVSLSYNWEGDPALEDLELPEFPLVFDQLVVQPFDAEQKALVASRVPLEVKAGFGAHRLYRG